MRLEEETFVLQARLLHELMKNRKDGLAHHAGDIA